MAARPSFGDRLRIARQHWQWTQDDLAGQAKVGVATIKRAETGRFDPRLETARRLADALSVRVEWLLTGDEPMVSLAQMTADTQHAEQTGPGTEGQPGFVVSAGGPWYRDGDEWRVEREGTER